MINIQPAPHRLVLLPRSADPWTQLGAAVWKVDNVALSQAKPRSPLRTDPQSGGEAMRPTGTRLSDQKRGRMQHARQSQAFEGCNLCLSDGNASERCKICQHQVPIMVNFVLCSGRQAGKLIDAPEAIHQSKS